MFRALNFLLMLAVAIGAIPLASAHAAGRQPALSPRLFDLRAGDIRGWMVGGVSASRRETNARAQFDSRSSSLYFYRGSLASLGRSTGWYERMVLYRGPTDAVTTVLASEFRSAGAASRAYRAVTVGLALKRLSIGTQAGKWEPRAGIASGPRGGADPFGTFTDYMQFGPLLAEITSRVTAPRRHPLLDPGPPIARELVSIIHVASIPVVSSTAVVDGLRLFLSVPDKVYPRNALAQLTVEITNLTGEPIDLLAQPDGSLISAIQVLELNAAGQVVPAPPPLQDYVIPGPPGPPIPVSIPPHETRTLQFTIILWSDHLQISAQCFGSAPCTTIFSNTIVVRLAAANTPSIDLLQSGAQPLALVHVAGGYQGRLLYRSLIQCRLTGTVPPNEVPVVENEVPAFAGLYAWERTTSILLSPPPCPQNFGPSTLSAWRLIVGWPDHSVGVLDYHVPSQESAAEIVNRTGRLR